MKQFENSREKEKEKGFVTSTCSLRKKEPCSFLSIPGTMMMMI